MMVELIQSVVEVVPVEVDGSVYPIFMHGEKEIQNALSDEIDLETKQVVVYLDEPITSNDANTQGGYLEESYALSMMFAKKTELDWTPEQHQEVITEMRGMRRRFINRLQANSSVRSISGISTTEVKNIFDVNLSGVIVRFTIVPFNSDSAC